MSDAIDVRRDDKPAPTANKSNWTELAKTAAANSMLLVPAECRPHLSRLWMCNAHLFPESMPLASTVRVYLDECDVTPDDINAIIDRLMHPAKRMHHKFHADLLCDLAREAVEAEKRNKAKRAAAERAGERIEFAAGRRTVLSILAGTFNRKDAGNGNEAKPGTRGESADAVRLEAGLRIAPEGEAGE